ncbi:hypothetical protein EDD11_008557 [Mortierella claussenii]|nr:hypothetical protein EDD11_008557 [Mortierella claussenii]
MDHFYESTSHHYPPFDVVPPPTQDLFRTLMEELQTQAAIQRDQFLTSSAKVEPSSTSSSENSANVGHGQSHAHIKPLPRFMMEPLDFLSSNYESYLEPGMHSNAGSGDPEPLQLVDMTQTTTSATIPSSVTQLSASTLVASENHAGDTGANRQLDCVSSKKHPLSDDSQRYSISHGTSTPPTMPANHEQLSPPTQDLFRMLMEELETQAALQRDHDLATSARSDATGSGMHATDFSFSSCNSHHQQQHHVKLPRFVMDPFDLFVDSEHTSEDQHVTTAEHHSTANSLTPSPLLPSNDNGHLAPPPQDLFRTLMEELETQAAFQRDQYLAETTGAHPRVDPDEYVFNGQHLRPLPRFMMEPLDFLDQTYDPCLTQGMNEQGSSTTHHFETSQTSGIHLDAIYSRGGGSQVMSQPGLTGRQVKKAPNKYKAILPQQLSPLAANKDKVVTFTTASRALNPAKKRKVSVATATVLPGRSISSSSLSKDAVSPLRKHKEQNSGSPTSPEAVATRIASPSLTDTDVDIDADTVSSEGAADSAGISAKRPWTAEEETLLLDMYTKRKPIKEIAQALDRTIHSVRSRRQVLTDPGFVKGSGHGVSRRCKPDPSTTTKLPTYAQMAFLSLAWLPDLQGTLSDVATMVEELFGRHLNRIPRTGHKNLQIWRAQISDALAHEKGQPRPRFESFGLKRGRQWVYRLTEFGRGMVEAMGGVETVCQDLLKSNEMEMAVLDESGQDTSGDTIMGDTESVPRKGASVGAGIGQGQGYGYSYIPPDSRKKPAKRTRPSRTATGRRQQQEEALAKRQQQQQQLGNSLEGSLNAIANAMEAMAAGFAKMMALEDERAARSNNAHL